MTLTRTALAFRRLRRRPLFTALATLTLTIALGAVSATFAVVNAALLRPLPFAESQRLVSVRSVPRTDISAQIGSGVSHANYVDLARSARTVSSMAAFVVESPTLSADGAEPVVLTSAAVTATLAEVLRVRPAIGRGVSAEDDVQGAPAVAVLGHDLWNSRFGGDSTVVGTTIVLDGLPHRVIGVFPRGFSFPLTAQLWTAVGSLPGVAFRGQHALGVVARLSDGVSVDAAEGEMQRLMSELAAAFPRENAARSLEVIPLREALLGAADRPVRLLWLATVAVWLLACVNIAWLLVARVAGERHEIAVRRALGATIGRLAAPWLHESVVIVVGAATAGSVLAVWCSRWLAAALGTAPAIGQPALDARVVAAALAFAAVTMGILAGIPTLVAARTTALTAVRPASTGDTRGGLGMAATSAVIVGQVAGAVVLSWAALVLIRSLDRATRVDLGFTPEGLYVASLRLPPYAYSDEVRIRAFYAGMLDDMRAVPGIASAAVALAHPLQAGFSTQFRIAGDPENRDRRARLRTVSAGYVQTVGTRIVAGREIGPADRADGPRVTLVNEAFAREHVPGRSAIGARVLRRAFGAAEPVAYEIIGVVADERFSGPHSAAEPALYVPFEQMPFASASLLVRMTVPLTSSVVRNLRAAVWRHERAVPFEGMRSMEDVASDFLATPRTLSRVLATFAGIAGLLVMIGIHGILAQAVSQRRRELAIRRALGATNGGVVGNVVGRAAVATAIGLAAGGSLVALASGVLRPFTFEVGTADPIVATLTALLLFAIATLGAIVPAWRAARVSPAAALRE